MLEECQEALCFFRTIGFWIFWCRSEEGSPSLVVLKILRMALFGCSQVFMVLSWGEKHDF